MTREAVARARALSKVVAEARHEAAPELDWARLEARLRETPAVIEAHAPSSPAKRVGFVLAAAAFLLAAGWFAAGGRVQAPRVASAEQPSSTMNGTALPAGASLSATTADLSVDHPGHALWTLERGGSATVTTRDGVVAVVLERGTVYARVVPSSRSESFVVEAAGTRVAVHGTKFRVALTAGHVDVTVEEGTVLVGSREQPGSGHSLGANQSSRFTLAGAPVGGETTPRSAPVRPARERSIPSMPRAPELREQPSIDEVETVIAELQRLASHCFETRTATAPGVRVTADTTVTLRGRPDGKVELTNLDPPLAPPVQSCIAAGVGVLTIAESQHGIDVVRKLVLER